MDDLLLTTITSIGFEIDGKYHLEPDVVSKYQKPFWRIILFEKSVSEQGIPNPASESEVQTCKGEHKTGYKTDEMAIF